MAGRTLSLGFGGLILAILFYKITLYPSNNIIDSFRSNSIVTNFSTIFLQSVEIANSYWFVSELITYVIFLLTNNTYHIINL